MEWVLLLVLVACVALFVFFKNKKQTQIHPEPVIQKKRYSAVRIMPHEHACNAAFDCSHRVYLAVEAPLLPLPDCDKADSCRCAYKHYDDRRHSGLQRRGESFTMTDVHDGRERRDETQHGRRKSD